MPRQNRDFKAKALIPGPQILNPIGAADHYARRPGGVGFLRVGGSLTRRCQTASALSWYVDVRIYLRHGFVHFLQNALTGVRRFVSSKKRTVFWVVQHPQIPRAAATQNWRGREPFVMVTAHCEFD